MPNAKTNLVIVESPSKAKTIGKYLGPDYQVKASMGHLRDLRKSTMSVDIDHDFEPEYYPIKGKEDIIKDLRMNFEGECSEVGMYLAMARVAHREGYPEVGLYYEKAAWEEAEHAAKFAELLGEVVTDSTKKNLQMRVEAENGATAGKVDLAKRAKAANLDAIHDTVHEMARDEARHGKAFAGLLKRYFGA